MLIALSVTNIQTGIPSRITTRRINRAGVMHYLLTVANSKRLDLVGYTGDDLIPCLIIPAERSSVFRQAKENTARSSLSAVTLARWAA